MNMNMSKIPSAPEIINEPSLSVDYVLKNKEEVVDFFGDNREWYKKLLSGNTNRSYSLVQEGGDLLRKPPQPTLWLHTEDALAIDEENPPLDSTLINEGVAEAVVRFFENNKEAGAAFIAYSQQTMDQK